MTRSSFHKKSEILKKIEQEMPKLHLEFLPEYSPDYNLIELVWHLGKEYVANHLFTSIEEIEYLLEDVWKYGESRKSSGKSA